MSNPIEEEPATDDDQPEPTAALAQPGRAQAIRSFVAKNLGALGEANDVFDKPITPLTVPAVKIFLGKHPETELYVTDSHGRLSLDPASGDGRLFLHHSGADVTLQVKVGNDLVALDFPENGNNFTLTPTSVTKIRFVRAMEEEGRAAGGGLSSYVTEYAGNCGERERERRAEHFRTILATAFMCASVVNINSKRDTIVFELEMADIEELKNEATAGGFNVLQSNRFSVTTTKAWEVGGDEISGVLRDALKAAGYGGKYDALRDHDKHAVGPYAIVFAPDTGKVFILSKHRYLG
ncbi:MAG: hypothetical protein AAB606_05550 [Patescibacteria group bacterium]